MTCEEAIRHEWFKELLIKTESEINQRVLEKETSKSFLMAQSDSNNYDNSSHECSPFNGIQLKEQENFMDRHKKSISPTNTLYTKQQRSGFELKKVILNL
jgi:hypothetical protein